MYQLPSESRTMRKLNPSNEWGWKELLLNNIWNQTRTLSWQLGSDGKSAPPEPFLPSFMPKPSKPKSEASKDTVAMDVADIRAFLNKPRSNVKVETNEQK